jgi:hypothetical protein
LHADARDPSGDQQDIHRPQPPTPDTVAPCPRNNPRKTPESPESQRPVIRRTGSGGADTMRFLQPFELPGATDQDPEPDEENPFAGD